MNPRLSVCTAILMISVFSVARAGIPESFPPEVKIVIRANVPKVRAVPVLQAAIARKTGGADKFISDIRTWTGVDLDKVETCWIGVEKEEHVVIVLQGEFSETAIENAILNIAAAQVVQRPDIPFAVMLPDDKRPGEYNLAAVLDETRIVFGRPDLVDGFLAAYTGAQTGLAKSKADLVASIEPSEAAVDAVILELPEKELKKNPWMELFTFATITADLREALDVHLRLGVKNSDLVDPMVKLLEGFRDVYKQLEKHQRKLPPIVEVLLENATLNARKDELLVDIGVPAEVFNRIAREKLLH